MRKSLMIAGAVLAAVSAARAAYLTNTDFELVTGGTAYAGWGEGGNGTAASAAPVAISGASSPKLIYVNAGNLSQNTVDTANELTKWTFDVDFAANDPGSSTARSFNLNLRHSASGFNQINVRLVKGTTAGTIQIYSAGGWNTVMADSATFSSSDTNLQVNHLRIVGDYSATPTYSVYVTDASNVTTSLTGLSGFQGTAAATGDRLRVVSFETGNYPTTGTAWAVVDNVSLVPEPAAMGLLATSGLMMMRRRRA